LYLTGHPIDRYRPEFAGLGITPIGSLSLDNGSGKDYRRRGQRVMVAGLAVAVSYRQTQRGRMASMVLDDRSGRIEVTLFSEACETYRDLLTGDRVLVVIGNLSHDEYRGGLSIRVDQVAEFEQVRAASASSLNINLDERRMHDLKVAAGEYILELEQILSAYRGGDCPLRLTYRVNGASAVLALGDEWRVQPTDELIRRLERFTLPGRVEVKYSYKARQRSPSEQVAS
jgi:DNA polymerase III subunit alpha